MYLISTCKCLPEFITRITQILVHALLRRSLYLHASVLLTMYFWSVKTFVVVI